VKSSKQDAEDLREKMWDPAARRRALQDAITWAESQRGVSRRTPQSRLAKQARLLKGLETDRHHAEA
jgi:hypothetical protein